MSISSEQLPKGLIKDQQNNNRTNIKITQAVTRRHMNTHMQFVASLFSTTDRRSCVAGVQESLEVKNN